MDNISQLYIAAKKNDIEAVKQLVLHKEVYEYIDLVLVEAAEHDGVDVVQYLIEDSPFKANIHFDNNKPFIWACDSGSWRVVKYFLSKGINEYSQGDFLYKQMILNNIDTSDDLFLTLRSKLKEKILSLGLTGKDIKKLNEYEQSAIEIKDTYIINFIQNIKLDKLQHVKEKTVIRSILDFAIKNNDYHIIEPYIDKFNIDDETLKLFYSVQNNNLLDKILSHCDIHNKNNVFIDSLKHNTYISLGIINKYSDYFENNHYYKTYDNMPEYESNRSYFILASLLPRYYFPIICENDLQAFSLMLLQKVLKLVEYGVDEYGDFDIKEYNVNNISIAEELLSNRKKLHIKDEHIVQIFAESNYDLDIGYDDDSLSFTLKYFDKLLNLLVKYNIDLSSDIHGYLIQIIGINNMNNKATLLLDITKQGSNINGLLSRIANPLNSLTKKEQGELKNEDVNNDRVYDIYKKFDSQNKIKPKNIEICRKIYDYLELDKELPSSNNKVQGLVKI